MQPVAGKYIEVNFSLQKQVLRCLFFSSSSYFSCISREVLLFKILFNSVLFFFFVFLFYCGDTLLMLTRAWKCVHCTLISIYNCIGNNNNNNKRKPFSIKGIVLLHVSSCCCCCCCFLFSSCPAITTSAARLNWLGCLVSKIFVLFKAW